ncbi:hypothetical protein OEA41_006227 [Lepraria neglecta]|uniref:Rhodopsin domain-containing protein n=1 Tax=Lepraria neglecta TaxID=209136 RepID=A0AAE0DKE7_9LECA|nr:hypothetical protein OEA41_006227 [Lepraria neglecta]
MVLGMGACLITGQPMILHLQNSYLRTIGVRKGVMGYPTPPPPQLSPAEELTHVEPSVEEIQKIEFAFQLLMLIAYGLIKASILFFYRRLFVVGKSGAFNLITMSTVVVVFLWMIAFLGLFTFNCGSAVDAKWGSLLEVSKSCKFSFTAEEGMASSDFILDLFVFLLPFPVIWRLHMTKVRKCAISGVFLIGAAAIAASITRLIIYVQILTNDHKLATASDKVILDENR